MVGAVTVAASARPAAAETTAVVVAVTVPVSVRAAVAVAAAVIAAAAVPVSVRVAVAVVAAAVVVVASAKNAPGAAGRIHRAPAGKLRPRSATDYSVQTR